MSKELATNNDLVSNLADIQTQVNKAAASEGAFIKFTKGEWAHGADDTEIEEDSIWAVNPQSFRTGFMAWGDADHGNQGVLEGEELVGLGEPPVLYSELPEVNADWAPAAGFVMACTSGRDDKLLGSFTSTSKGGVRAISVLINEVVDYLKANPDTENNIPLVSLGTDSYKHASYGKVHTPIITITKWVNAEGKVSKTRKTKAA